MAYYNSEVEVPKEEAMSINEWITINNAPFHRTTGEAHLEDREEEDDINTTPQMPHLPWTTHLSPWTCLGAVPQPIGKDEEIRGIGGNRDHKDEWPKDLGTVTMHALTVDRLDTMPGTVCRDKGATCSPVMLDWVQWSLLPHSSGQLCILYTGDQVC